MHLRMGLAQLLFELVNTKFRTCPHRPAAKRQNRAIWRHSSDPMGPRTGDQHRLAGEQVGQAATSSCTGARPSRSSSSILRGPVVSVLSHSSGRGMVSRVRPAPAAYSRMSRRSGAPGGLATRGRQHACRRGFGGNVIRTTEHRDVLRRERPNSAGNGDRMPTGCHWVEPLSARSASESDPGCRPISNGRPPWLTSRRSASVRFQPARAAPSSTSAMTGCNSSTDLGNAGRRCISTCRRGQQRP